MKKIEKKKKTFETFLVGKAVDLILINNTLIKSFSWHTWLNDQKITKLTKQGYFPLTKKEHLKYINDNIFSKKRLQVGILKKKSNSIIGMISLYNINHLDRCCSVSALMNMNNKEIDSVKYLIEAQNLLIEHAFRKLNLRRVEAAANDKKLCKLNEKLFKFKCEGVLKERDYIDGKYRDRFMLAILKKDWNNENKKIG